jgi:hypothetical protein
MNMIPASKLDDLYKELEPLAGKTLLDSPSRAEVQLVSNLQRLQKRTWQQEDLFILCYWLPAGQDAVSLNLDNYYKNPSDLMRYLPLIKESATDDREDQKVMSIYKTFALIKNFLLLQKIRAKALSNEEDTVSGQQLLNFAQLSKAKMAMLPFAEKARNQLIELGRDEFAHELYAEVVKEFKARELSVELIMNSKKCEFGTPVTQQVQLPPNPLPVQRPTVAAIEVEPQTMVDIFLTPPDSPRQPSSPSVSLEASYMSDAPVDSTARASSWCLMFSSCLSFLKPNPTEYEMHEMTSLEIAARTNEGYIRLNDQESEMSGAEPSVRGHGYQPWN